MNYYAITLDLSGVIYLSASTALILCKYILQCLGKAKPCLNWSMKPCSRLLDKQC